MRAISTALRWFVGTCLSLLLLYCGAGMILAITLGKSLPAFPFSWVDWLNRPNIPPMADHVINFLLASMVATLFRDLWRRNAAAPRARSSQI